MREAGPGHGHYSSPAGGVGEAVGGGSERGGGRLKRVERDLMMKLEGFDARQARAMTDAMNKGKYAPDRVKRFVSDATRLGGGRISPHRSSPGAYRIVPPAGLTDGASQRAPFIAVFDPTADAAPVNGAAVEFITAGHSYLLALINHWTNAETAQTALFQSDAIRRQIGRASCRERV